MVKAYMGWMQAMDDSGFAGEYTPCPDAEVQGESHMKVIDILGKQNCMELLK